MTTTEVNDSIIGKRCKSIFTGLMVTGVIEEIRVNEHTVEVKVRYDEPHNWGGQWYECDWSFARLHDEFGSLCHLEIIDNGYEVQKMQAGKRLTKSEMAYQISNVEPLHPAAISWDFFRREEIVTTFNRIFGTEIE